MTSRLRLLLTCLSAGLTGCLHSTPAKPSPSPTPSPAPRAAPSGPPYVWPNGASAAVSLTYDDAIPSQLDNAAPALARHGLLATFFLTGSSPTLRAWPERFRALLKAGHELGSHTMTHPCDRGLDFVKPGMSLQDFDLARMDAELVESVKQLRDLGQTGPLSFAYPCGSTWLGEARTSYVPLIEQSFIAARGVSPTLVDPHHARLFDVPSVMGNASADVLTSWVERAIATRSWLVFTFHGVAGDHMSVKSSAHEALLAYLEQHRQSVWTERFGAVAQYVAARASD
ncbi:MAG: polysaccharide deacetylase family protein [Polyangiaceae bacterium]